MTISDLTQKSKELYTRKNPCLARFISCTRLNKEGSSKENLHIVLDLEEADIPYEVGSSFGIFPENSQESVEEILSILDISLCPIVFDVREEISFPLPVFLQTRANLTQVTSKHLDLILKYHPSTDFVDLFSDPLKKKAFLEGHDLFTFLAQFWRHDIPIQELIDITSPLLPRYYSIASSKKVEGSKVHFMCASFSYLHAGRIKHSITAKYFRDICTPNHSQVRIFLQENKNFILPSDPKTPIIMIGPGTGVAVFRGFLQERALTGEKENNWLFTGDRERKYDFHYEEEFTRYEKEGFLRLDVAFSRDSEEKIYVQDLMQKHSSELFSWINDKKAHIYICGDAKKMAKDVQHTLLLIVQNEANLSEEEAKEYIKALKGEKRLLLDVY